MRGRFEAVDRVQGNEQRRHPVDRGSPVRQTRIVVDEPIERGLDRNERRGRLGDLAQAHCVGEVLRRAQDQPDERTEKGVSV